MVDERFAFGDGAILPAVQALWRRIKISRSSVDKLVARHGTKSDALARVGPHGDSARSHAHFHMDNRQTSSGPEGRRQRRSFHFCVLFDLLQVWLGGFEVLQEADRSP